MKKHVFAFILCALLFMLIPAGAFAQVLDKAPAPDADSLPGALETKDRKKVLEILEKKTEGIGIVVDLETFNAVVFGPTDPEMYYQMPDCENRVLVSYFINPNADEKTAVDKVSRGYFYDGTQFGKYKDYYYCFCVDTRNLKLPERELTEFDPILDSALFVREVGYYDLNMNVCTGCGTYLTNNEIEKHCVLECGVHMTCYHDVNDITHHTVCAECGRMKCSCYCNNYLSVPLLISISGGKEYAVGGDFHENVFLSFESDAKVTFFGDTKTRNKETVPSVKCCICDKDFSLPTMDSFFCVAHFACPECRGKMTEAQVTEHEEELECGHYACDGKKHSTEIYSEYCPNYVKHHKCEGYTNEHHCPVCNKDFTCDEGMEHAGCLICGGNWCDGRAHGMGNCG